ncbi:MAG TPA: hypothetical protein VIM11_12055 [Tepidisphaeraceae bacterium]|jgi:hypothetical protein
MTRRLVAILSCVLFVLAVFIAGLWIHSQDMGDRWEFWPNSSRCIVVQSVPGQILLTNVTIQPGKRPVGLPTFSHRGNPPEYVTDGRVRFSPRQWQFETGISAPVNFASKRLSIGALFLAFVAMPAGWVLWHVVRSARRSAVEVAENPQTEAESLASWPEHAGEIECPMCGYNLRGLATPRCPECGYSFSWAQLLDPTRRRHPYLFEHSQRHRLQRLFKTLTRNWEPNTFWRTLYPSQTPVTARLLFYGFLCMFVAATPTLAVVWAMARKDNFNRFPTWQVDFKELLLRKNLIIVWLSLVMAFYPLLTAISLLIFQQSMRRAKVKAGHALRCAIYSGDVIVWGVLLQWAAILFESMDTRGWGTSVALARMLTLGIVLTLAVTFMRLIEAYKHYMKFPHVLATIGLSQFAVILLMTWVVIRATGAELFQ